MKARLPLLLVLFPSACSRPPSVTPSSTAPIADCSSSADDLGNAEGLITQFSEALVDDQPARWDRAAREFPKLFGLSMFSTAGGEAPITAPSSGVALRDWWSRGGKLWLTRQLHADGTTLAFPPTMRPALAADALPAELRCRPPGCQQAAEYLEFVEDHGLLLLAYERRRFDSFEWFPSDLIAGGMNPAQQRCPRDDVETWTTCIAKARSSRTVFPTGNYAFPERGWLFMLRGGMVASECPEATAVDMSTGDAWWTTGCQLHHGGSDLLSFRELALLAITADLVVEIRDGQHVEVSENLRPASRCAIADAPSGPNVQRSHHDTLDFWWVVDGTIIASHRLSPGDYDKPADDLVSESLRGARIHLMDTPDSPSLPDVAKAGDPSLVELVNDVLSTAR